ncbi:Membrane protein OS=Streptomyces microflavus OX=1919 GN=Smic_03540 PE=4 SV=1 [Streptomyces microflavus]
MLDEVLASAEIQRLLERSGVGVGQLRIRALASAARTAPAAAPEYQAYAALRRELHGRPLDGGPSPLSGPGDQERPGAGALALLGVLTPILAAVAGATFLLLGYGLRLAGSLVAPADTLVRVGWFSLAVAAATALVTIVALYRTAALQSAPASPPGSVPPTWTAPGRPGAPPCGTRRSRPFLIQELAEEAPGGTPDRPARFTPPAFAGPDFSSPGFSGPGHGSPDAGSPRLPDTRR